MEAQGSKPEGTQIIRGGPCFLDTCVSVLNFRVHETGAKIMRRI